MSETDVDLMSFEEFVHDEEISSFERDIKEYSPRNGWRIERWIVMNFYNWDVKKRRKFKNMIWKGFPYYRGDVIIHKCNCKFCTNIEVVDWKLIKKNGKWERKLYRDHTNIFIEDGMLAKTEKMLAEIKKRQIWDEHNKYDEIWNDFMNCTKQ